MAGSEAAARRGGVSGWLLVWERCQNTGKWRVSAGCGVIGGGSRALGLWKVRILERVLEKKMAMVPPVGG